MLRSWVPRAKCRIAFLSWVETSTEHNRKVKRSNDSRSWGPFGKNPVVPHQTEALTGLGHPGENGKAEAQRDSSLYHTPEVVLGH